jgi:hypothetical protein
MNKSIQNLLRWIVVLPGCILAGILATFLLHFLLYLTLTKFVTPYPEFPERALTPFVIAITFIWYGCQIAPAHKLKVGITLFAVWIFFAGGLIMSTLTGGKWFGKTMYFEAKGIAALLSIAGAFVGLYLVWRKNAIKEPKVVNVPELANEAEIEAEVTASKNSFYDRFGTDIFNLIFVTLFTWCLFYTTAKQVIFIILLILNLIFLFFSFKEKLYSTKTMKLNMAKNGLMVCLLALGLFNSTIGFYVAYLCLLLGLFELMRHFIIAHVVKKISRQTYKPFCKGWVKKLHLGIK